MASFYRYINCRRCQASSVCEWRGDDSLFCRNVRRFNCDVLGQNQFSTGIQAQGKYNDAALLCIASLAPPGSCAICKPYFFEGGLPTPQRKQATCSLQVAI